MDVNRKKVGLEEMEKRDYWWEPIPLARNKRKKDDIYLFTISNLQSSLQRQVTGLHWIRVLLVYTQSLCASMSRTGTSRRVSSMSSLKKPYNKDTKHVLNFPKTNKSDLAFELYIKRFLPSFN